MAKFILITGANGGIGNALCTVFGNAGYAVIATDSSPNRRTNCEHYIPLDLIQFARHQDLRDHFSATLGDILRDGELMALINNAATQRIGDLGTLSADDFRTTLDVNVTSPFLLSQICLPFLENSKGSILNIGSIHASLTKAGFVAYATSKAALAGLTRASAVDLGSRGIRVNAIQPAAIETDMLLAGFTHNPDGYITLKDYHPIKRLGLPNEVAELGLFLCSSEHTGFISGATIDLTGGIHAKLHDPD